jgi:serine/threonine protein kinase
MPKKKKDGKRWLEERLYLSERKPPGRFSNPTRRSFILEWMDEFIYYKKRVRKIDLKNVYDWEVKRDRKKVKYKLKTQWLDWEIILKVKTGTIDTEWKIMGPDYKKRNNDVFHTWLYWIMVSLIEHSKCEITEEDEKMLRKDRRKKKIRGRQDRKAFDVRHKTFISLLEDISKEARRKLPKKRRTAFKGEGGSEFQGVEFIPSKLLGESKIPVFLAKWKKPKEDDWDIAVKVVDLKAKQQMAPGVINEARILAAAGPHPNLIRLIDVKAFKNFVTVYMEKADKTLDKVANELTTHERIGVAGGILNGVSHLHSRGIYHLDLKPPNIMVLKTEVGQTLAKIIDFDTAYHKAAYSKRSEVYTHWDWSRCGTRGYIPPESFGKPKAYKPSKSEHLEKRDAYAIGVSFMDSLIGPRCSESYKLKPLFDHNFNTVMRYLKRVEHKLGQDKAKLEGEGLYGLTEIAMKMINHDMDKRITVKEAKEEFQNMMKTSGLIKRFKLPPKKEIKVPPKRKVIEILEL